MMEAVCWRRPSWSTVLALGLMSFSLVQGPVAGGQETRDAAPAAAPADAAAVPTETSPTVAGEGAVAETAAPSTPSGIPMSDTEAIDTGNNAWMLVSCALVLFMTAPGLALFYGGLVRKKNVLSIMMQCLFLMGLMTTIWGMIGFSLAFGTNENETLNLFIGDFEYAFMNNVQAVATTETVDGEPVLTQKFPMKAGYGIPMLTFMMFQGMFFIITPALICGAFAERMKFSTMVVFSILWGLLVYCPLAHCVWGGGMFALSEDNTMTLGGALDFAGGTVVHISSGVSALVCAIMLGRRVGYGSAPMPPHNLTYTALGAAMLWVGWFGFNAGSELMADGVAASALVVTQFCAATGALAWVVVEMLHRGKPSVLGAASGAVAGLVVITPAAGYVQPMPALVMGLLAGVVCYFACSVVKGKIGYDDSLDAFGVHGVGGTLGAILTGVFATKVLYPSAGDNLGLIEGGSLIGGQLAATLFTWVFAIVMTAIILLALKFTMGLRVTQEEEVEGLDVTQHGEEGYIFI